MIDLRFTIYDLRFKLLLLTAYCLLSFPAHAEIVDRVVAVVNDSAITLSELNVATAGLEDIKGNDKDKRKKIIETKSKVLDQLIEKKLVEQASNKAGITISEKEIDNAIEDVKRQNNVSQQELLSALARNGLTFKEYREQLKDQIRQVKFINKEFRSNAKISNEDIEAYYRQNQGKFSGPVTHRLRIISLLSSEQDKRKDIEKKADNILAAARGGEDFVRLAKEYSQGPNAKEGGDLGYIKAGEMDAAIERAATGLKTGEISNVIKTSTGFHIIQLIDKQGAAARPLSEVEDEIRNTIFQKVIDERYKLWLEEVMKKAYIEVRL
ncbi:MAG: peptidylprolyl isomerase [Deltaproteobacteria bacterium]|nr:peptidylprolyl isomerase [Deltaproteobacteria bacterium]